MSQITKRPAAYVPQQVLEKLSVVERSIVSLSNTDLSNHRIKDMGRNQRIDVVSDLLNRVQVKLGLKPKEGNDYDVFLEAFQKEIQKFPQLTNRELAAAVEAGLDGKFLPENETKVFFNLSVFVQWVNRWVEDIKKPAMKVALQQKLELPPPDRSEKEFLISKYQFFLNAVLEFAERGKDFIDAGGLVYEFLVQFSRIEPVSKEDVEGAAVIELQRARLDLNRSKAKEMARIIEKLPITETIDESPAHSIACRIAVMKEIKKVASWPGEDQIDYFDALKADMEEYFKTINTP